MQARSLHILVCRIWFNLLRIILLMFVRVTKQYSSFCKEEKRRRSGLRQVFMMSQKEIQASYWYSYLQNAVLRSYYILSWHVRAITSSCCSLVRSMNFTAYPDTRIVKFAYSSFSGCSIASISFSFPNTFTLR